MRRKVKFGSGSDATKKFLSSGLSTKLLKCETLTCEDRVKVDVNCVSVLCYKCTHKTVPHDKKVVVEKSNRPAGWRFMKEYVDADGTVYHSGVEVPELKGTITPTDVDALKQSRKAKRLENKLNKKEKEEKRQQKLIREFEKKKALKKELENKQYDVKNDTSIADG